MGRKPRISVEEKVFICEKYLNGIKSMGRLAKDNGINTETIRRWINRKRSKISTWKKERQIPLIRYRECKIKCVN